MKTHLSALALLVTTAALALPARAQSLRAGLWEVNNKMQSGNGELEKAMAQMQQQMANMSPEQRKTMEDMMARQGVHISASGNGIVAKVCVSKEMAARNELPMPQNGNCSMTSTAAANNSVSFVMNCSNPPGSGSGQITFNGDAAYTMTSTINTTAGGHAQSINFSMNGKWLGEDCGAIKPAGAR